MEKEDYVVRLEEENSQLKERLSKLIAFIEGKRFDCLTRNEQADLIKQQEIMLDYQNILCKRLLRIYGRQQKQS